MSIRSKVGKLRSRYTSLEKAETELGIDMDAYIDGLRSAQPAASHSTETCENQPFIPLSRDQIKQLVCQHTNPDDLEEGAELLFKKLCELSHSRAVGLLDRLAALVSQERGFLSTDLVSSNLDAMTTLFTAGKDPLLV